MTLSIVCTYSRHNAIQAELYDMSVSIGRFCGMTRLHMDASALREVKAKLSRAALLGQNYRVTDETPIVGIPAI